MSSPDINFYNRFSGPDRNASKVRFSAHLVVDPHFFRITAVRSIDLLCHAAHGYWVTHRSPKLLFPHGRSAEERHNAREPMDRGGTQKSFKTIVTDVGIRKDITIHTLRHCYGTLLTDADVSLRAIQEQMGHECPKTTALYTAIDLLSERHRPAHQWLADQTVCELGQ